ncbi:hypothetical protein [Bacillus cereus group sp. TH150LC]|uniref:hypothetical protein n=1 Tax=Bacillus cereus group sp. TH150LC TaxID=3018061 RepID=UPI0022E18F6C|nr:hypothetical protein [Bacillus cereus group sp. TH150LC]MDA1654276.1 hypothetical protein [Bacillus cereus group sp. TH150LC]
MPIYYTKEEYEKILDTNEKEPVFMPNEIFEDLPRAINVNRKGKSSKHIAYAFSYVFLVTYLYRYTKFGTHADYEFTEEELKRLLTVSPTSKGKNGVTYITKKNGILEQLGYIKKVTDYPLGWFYDKADIDSYVEFRYFSEIKEDGLPSFMISNLKNKKVNYPVKLLDERTIEINEEELECPGILYDINYTTETGIDVFIYCMTRKELGVEGFYLYCLIKFMSGFYGGSWNCAQSDFPARAGMKIDVIKTRLKALEQYGMLNNSHEDFIIGLDGPGYERIANSYCVRSFSYFVKEGEVKRPYSRGRVITKKEYEKVKEMFNEGDNEGLWGTKGAA